MFDRTAHRRGEIAETGREPFVGRIIAPVLVCSTFLALALLVSCSSGSKAVQTVSLASLAGSPEHWKGDLVRVQGTLVTFTDPDGSTYGVVQDTSMNRVGLKSVAAWQSLVGKTVMAQGILNFDPASAGI